MRPTLIAALAALTITAANAQDFPNKTITVMVPFAAGGSTDMVARLTADGLARALGGATVIVENVAGAGGTIASTKLANAKPDGYTLMVHHVGLASADTLYRQLPYKTKTSFQPLAVLTHTASTIIGRPDIEPNTFGELIEYIKKNKDKVTLAHAGLGAASHLCGMLLQHAIGIQVTTVPYRGNGPVMNDLRGKQVDLTCDQATATTSHIKANAIKAYAVTTKARIADLPELPTADEAGLKGFELSVWHGIYAPAGTPQSVVDKLVEALQKAIAEPAYVEKMKGINTSIASKEEATPAGLTNQLHSEIDRWAPIIRAAGQYAD